MRVYLAARFGRKEEMRLLSLEIKKLGIEVTSRWLVEAEAPTEHEEREKFLRSTAGMDLRDVRRADILVRFSDDRTPLTVPSDWMTASRMEESGMAQAWEKKIIIVGGNQSLFDRLSSRVHVENAEELLRLLKRMKEQEHAK